MPCARRPVAWTRLNDGGAAVAWELLCAGQSHCSNRNVLSTWVVFVVTFDYAASCSAVVETQMDSSLPQQLATAFSDAILRMQGRHLGGGWRGQGFMILVFPVNRTCKTVLLMQYVRQTETIKDYCNPLLSARCQCRHSCRLLRLQHEPTRTPFIFSILTE